MIEAELGLRARARLVRDALDPPSSSRRCGIRSCPEATVRRHVSATEKAARCPATVVGGDQVWESLQLGVEVLPLR
jgi:hypothetical protein